jgi:putative tryptophan/tyrosine transport system substrate-binding protein
MQRREFIAGLGSAAAWPLTVRAQQAGKVRRIGFVGLSPNAITASNYLAFVQGMLALGYVEEKDFVMESRFADGRYERFPALATELVQLNVDVFLTGMVPAVRALQDATPTIPIVFAGVTDPVGSGLVSSLARPGGNTTGLAGSYDDTALIQVELLAMAVANLSRLGLLFNPETATKSPILRNVQVAAQKAGFVLVPERARNSQEIETAFADFTRENVQAVIVASDGVFIGQRRRLAELALAHGLPTIFPQREFTEEGGLMSYGESLREFYQRAAYYVDKIFKGAKPADPPVEQPTRFHLVINRKTADALGVIISPKLYAFADEMIE